MDRDFGSVVAHESAVRLQQQVGSQNTQRDHDFVSVGFHRSRAENAQHPTVEEDRLQARIWADPHLWRL